jgi:HAD superfamily hydrolase (TIGR01509 family)
MLHCFKLVQPSQSLESILFTSSAYSPLNWQVTPILILPIIYVDSIDEPLRQPVQKTLSNKKPIPKREKPMWEGKLKANGIFLDLDGTIVDSKDAYIEAAKIAFEAIGQEPPNPNLALEIPRRLEQGLSITDITNGETKRFLSTYIEAYYSATPLKTKLLPNVAQTLALLSKNAKLAVVTMRHVERQAVIRELEAFGVLRYFSYVVTSLDTTKPKPSPEAIIKCVGALGLDMDSCVMAGDSVNDVRAGKAAGAKTIAVLSGLFGSEELLAEGPDLVLDDVSSLPNFVQ